MDAGDGGVAVAMDADVEGVSPDYDIEEGEIIDDDSSCKELHEARVQEDAAEVQDQRKSGKRRRSSSESCHDEEGQVNKPSKSHRRRSRSKSVSEESFKSHNQDDIYDIERGRCTSKFDDDSTGYIREYRHGSRGSSIENDRDSRREKDRDRERDSERHRKRGREKERERDTERKREKDRYREREKGSEREHERERDRERDTFSERKERERRNRDREIRGRSREGDRDRHIDRSSRHRRYDDVDDGYAYNRRNRHYETDTERDRTADLLKAEKQKTVVTESEKSKRDEVEQEDYQEKIAFQLAEQEEEQLDRIKEESRRRRQAILEKYKNQQSQKEQVTQSRDSAEVHADESTENRVAGDNAVSDSTDGPANGADVHVNEPTCSSEKSSLQGGHNADEQTSGTGGLGQGTPESKRSADMFCDDIFGESPAGIRKKDKGDGLPIERSCLRDNWDDPEGYYGYRFGELLDGHYEILAAHGKGVFSNVVRARDLKARPGDPEEVAIKIIRNNETMYKAGMDELVILKKLAGADPEDKYNCVRLISSFKYRNHLCLVFESLQRNLRELLKKYGRNIGLNLDAVRLFAKKLFTALKHLKSCGVLHCDIKPDNILVNEAKSMLKLCDFGNAMLAGKNEITPYLVSRFYRAPEIILGLAYDHPMDIWSVGCCLFELYAGKVLFPGPSNNDMLRLHMELKGPFPKKMLRKGAFTHQHFDQDLNFLGTEEDPVTKKAIRKLIVNIKPKDFSSIVSGHGDLKTAQFKDLLERIFVLDPEKRITISQALKHPFITNK